jgi:hypothetical protein
MEIWSYSSESPWWVEGFNEADFENFEPKLLQEILKFA